MSRQRARSPGYRTFPWEEPDFDPQKLVAELDEMPLGWDEGEGPRGESWGERRHPQYQQRERRSEETYHRRMSSPHHEPPHYLDAGEGPRHREAFRENEHYEDRRGEVQPQHNRNYAQREPEWRQDQQDRGSRERFRDRSPLRNDRNSRQRGRGRGAYKRTLIHNDKWTPDNQQHINRNRREMDGSPHSGYEWEEQRYSADERREGFYRNDHEPHKFEQNRNEPMEPPRREHYSPERDIHRQRSSRSISQEHMRGGNFEENRNNDGYHRERRSPFADERPNYDQYRDRPANRGGTRGSFNRRGRFSRRGRGWPRGNRPQPQRFQNTANEQPRFREEDDFYDEPEPAWEQREAEQAWEDEDRGREMANLPSHDLEMQRPREQWGGNETKPNMMVITEETLTVKVDMSRPVNKNSLMLYSANRPLSLDLVHVGRQRLDFLSSAERPGSDRDNVVQTGTFAQEVITLVHQVKDQYFGGQGITLTQRFSEIKKTEENEEAQEMTLNKRFSANRGLNVNYNSLPDREEPLFSKQGPLQLLGSPPLRDPDDLRHDLEKRRQERLEGVKVTIAGQSRPQRPPSDETYGDNDKVMEEEEFSNWSDEPQWRQEGPAGPKRGGPFRPLRRNNRSMRRPNYRSNGRGQNW